MNFDMVGLHPDSAMGIVLKLYDEKLTEKEKINLLLNNRVIEKLNSVDLPVNFASGVTIDINAGELLGLGAVVSYFNWIGELADGDTYQVGVGVEDSVKAQTENLLSDGAIWHDQSRAKTIVQQVMTQGFHPIKIIQSSDIIAQIKYKAGRITEYPDNCALIVNVFSEAASFDLATIRSEAAKEIACFSQVYVVIYEFPLLEHAVVYYISNPDAPSLKIKLLRHPLGDKWYFNFDAKRRLGSS